MVMIQSCHAPAPHHTLMICSLVIAVTLAGVTAAISRKLQDGDFTAF